MPGLFGGSKSSSDKSSDGNDKDQFVAYGSSSFKGKDQTDVYYGEKGAKDHGHIAIDDKGKTVFHEGPNERSNKK